MQSSVLLRMHNLVVLPNLCRCICLNSTHYNVIREGRFLRKMLSGNKRRKIFFNKAGAVSQAPPLTNKNFVPTHRTRRAEVLNKLFMKHITDLMATGEVAPQLLGRGIDISHVSVTTDFKHLNVFWYSKALDKALDESTERVLQKCGGQLQHELSQLRVIGIVPPIRFVKNKHLSLVNEVEERLSKIDFGEDFIPSNKKIKQDEPVIFTKLSSDTKSAILDVNITNQSEDPDAFEVVLPEMRHDVFGLDRYEIMKKVNTSLNKAQKSMKSQSPHFSANEVSGNSFNIEQHLSTRERRELFTQFLKKRQIENKQRSDSRTESHDDLVVSDNSQNDENDYLMEEERDDDFEIEESSLQQWK